LSHVLHQYQTVAAAANPSAAAATQYFYQPLATLLPYKFSSLSANGLYESRFFQGLPGGSAAFAAGSRQPQYVSFAPATQSLVPQFVPVSIMDPTMLAAQAQAQWQGAAAAATGSQLLWPAPTIFPPATELFMPSLQAMATQRAATQFNQVFAPQPAQKGFGIPPTAGLPQPQLAAAQMATAFVDEAVWAQPNAAVTLSSQINGAHRLPVRSDHTKCMVAEPTGSTGIRRPTAKCAVVRPMVDVKRELPDQSAYDMVVLAGDSMPTAANLWNP
uniref:40S_SA_C domain-containing protein n=1 Tax=Angiostrongylus cantonensis TaxID=6313 RepID=A0A0K0D263_ANGCA